MRPNETAVRTGLACMELLGVFMSRSGYSDDCDNLELYRNAVECALKGKRGQAFLRELAAAMDAMPVKELITGKLVSESGAVCAIGAVCKARNIDVSKIDESEPACVADAMGIARSMAAEIAYMNDEWRYGHWNNRNESNAERWARMRKWVSDNIVAETPNDEAEL